MEISVKLGSSQESENYTFSLDDLGLDKLEWDLLNDEEKKDVIQEAVFDLPSQPYWMVCSFNEYI